MLRSLLYVLIAAAPPAAQQPVPKQDQGGQRELWVRSGSQIALVPARTAFPLVAGPISFAGNREFSHEGEGIDAGLHYRSADQQVLGTVYVYLPGLSHSGLAAYATDQGIRVSSQTPVRVTRTSVVAAGNVERSAIRVEYENYRGGLASSAAFIKAGRWTVKIRVSGPQARSADVAASMDALLRGIEFGRANPPHPAMPINVSDCPAGVGQQDARSLPDPAAPEMAAHAMLGTFDGGGIEATDENGARSYLPSRVPQDFCLSSRAAVGTAQIPVLRAAGGPPRSIDGRTRLMAVISDSGTWIEVVHAPNLNRYLILYHQIGSTALLGGYDNVPSDRQIADLLNNPAGDAARIRSSITLRPGQGPQINLPSRNSSPGSPRI